MPTQVLVYDAVAERSWDLLFSDDAMETITKNWATADKLLTDLKDTNLFDGASQWDQLKPVHYKTLIASNFMHLDRLSEEQLKNLHNPVSVSMSFLVGCLIKCVSMRSQLDVEMLKIRRFSTDKVQYDFTCSLNQDHTKPDTPAPETKGPKLVVDNTKV